MSEDDEARRQQEINMFAAMAQGDAAEFNSATFDAAAFSDDQQDSNEGGSRELFVQAALGADPTGTFNLQEDGASTPSSSSVAKNYNLEAAAAAFADGEDNGSHISTADGPAAGQRLFMSPNRPSTQADNFPKLAPRTPMHTQQMLLPKPLFFGCQLPPRVVKEAREIVQSFPADRPYPPEVRNLLSAIKAYGHGLDLLQEDSKPSPYVSLFCPKWSVVLPPWTESDPTSGEGGKEDPGDDSNIASTPPSDNAEGTPSKTASGNTSTNETRTPSTPDTVSELSERDMFSMWAQGNDSAIGSPDNKGLQSSTLQRENSTGSSSASIQRDSVTETEIMSDRDLFSQWARGESFRENGSTRNLLGKSTKSIVSDGNVNRRSLSQSAEKKGKDESVAKAGSINFLNSGTFMNLPMQDDSDDDELVVSELKKKVGVNEHLNAALAYLEEDQNDVRNAGENSALEESNNRLAQVPLTHDGGRPLTNHELMNGVAPLFGSDDSTLPTEADLGIHETRDEQQRSREQRRNQGIIENCCPQNIFGLISCPDPSMNPHDNHSWNSRATPPTHPRIHPAADFQPLGVPRTVAHAKLGVLPTQDLPSKPQVEPRSNEKSLSAPTGSNPPSSGASIASKAPHLVDKKFDPRQRYGWWNVPDHDDLSTEPASAIEGAGNGNEDTLDLSENQEEQPPLQLPPLTHASTNVLVQTKLEPNPEKLHEQNRPLSQLHPATVYAQSLPFLSDRPPSYRYLQIDTQAVGFLGLGGEIEPLFCSLAIYHIETIAPGTTKDPSLAPIPDLQRCGKVTETLNFDVVSDPSVEKHCHRALWPYTSESDDDKLQGTRCGVFPLPSNLNIYNLYAVLVVQKVVSEGSDFEIYLRPGKSANNGDAGGSDAPLNIDILRNRAEKAAKQQGKFIMPFAFGVAPLLQVFGADVPVVPSSRAVQIPLFRFSAGLGDRQIIDHIMVMLYPRADHKASGIGGPAPVTNRGTAMLVMRNFGYLGLHSVVHSKSSLARDRLVSFTGEMQIRRREASDIDVAEPLSDSPDVHILPGWHKGFFAEPTVSGGRIMQKDLQTNGVKDSTSMSQSPLYAQELAPLRLNATLALRNSTTPLLKSQRARGHHVSGDDIEPYFHTSFCNELVCHPRLLHNCPKGNIVIKVEMRDLEWIPKFETFVAHLPAGGPAVHNRRRGPFLVQGAFTSCSARCLDPHYLDEFKIRLPLLLGSTNENPKAGRKPSIFFTVYRLSFSPRKKWGKLFRSKKTGKKLDEIAGETVGETQKEIEAKTNCHLIQLSCGYLPLASHLTMIADGNHDIKMTQIARYPKSEAVKKGVIESTTLVLSDIPGIDEGGKAETDEVIVGDGESVVSSQYVGDNASATSASESASLSEITDVSRSKGKVKSGDPICLQVRIAVHSSVHSQSSVLNDFLGQEPHAPALMKIDYDRLLRFTREEMYQQCFDCTATFPASDRHYDNAKLLISVVDISKVSMCPLSEVSEHLIRVVSQLLKVIVSGTSETDLRWANPATLFPLRIQAFATLLQLLGSCTIFSSKRGLSQLDGSNKWNVIALSRVLALAFDEGSLFGDYAAEMLNKDVLLPKMAPPVSKTPLSKEKRRRHVRSNFEFLNNAPGGDNQQNVSDENGGNDIFAATSAPDKSSFSTTAKSVDESLKKDETLPIKVDSVTDFRSALKAGSDSVEDDGLLYDGSSTGSPAAMAMVKAYSGPQAMSRRWMTAPSTGLATIREDIDDDADNSAKLLHKPPQPRKDKGPLDSLDTELLVKAPTSSVKQMRVPKILKKESDQGSTFKKYGTVDLVPKPPQSNHLQSVFGSDQNQELQSIPFESNRMEPSSPVKHIQRRSNTLPSTDAEIVKAGTSFLDAVELSLGIGGMIERGTRNGEGERVGQGHHKKTKSRCSIDWSIPNDDIGRFSAVPTPTNPREGQKNDFDESMTTLLEEKEISTKLPFFIDRLMACKESSIMSGRWFPFTYEVIIMQWAGLLDQQRKSESESCNQMPSQDFFGEGENQLADAASRASGVAIACAPALFEIIKQSLGWRIANVNRRLVVNGAKASSTSLVILDETLMTHLERIIESITLACIDFRNFDAWETRQTCIDVNDSLVWFLRDLFAYLDPACSHRLIMIYLTRLLGANGKLPDRDSNTGLRCSWEVTKLQLNAVSALVRFPDFMKVNSPQFHSLSESLFHSHGFSAVSFFDDLLEYYAKLNPHITNSGDVATLPGPHVAVMKPHWLAEIIVDVCIIGTEHAEHNIQRRASSLLVETFWGQSQAGMMEGNSSIVASMHVTFLEKVITRTKYIARCFSAKSQVRQDILRSVVFILQSAPGGLLRAVWRKLFSKSTGKGFSEKYGGTSQSMSNDSDDALSDYHQKMSRAANDWQQEADIFEMFSLINLSVATFEYEGTDEHAEAESPSDDDDGPYLPIWKREFLLSRERETQDRAKRHRLMVAFGKLDVQQKVGVEYATTSSRRWHSHDGSIVLIKTTQQIVRELRNVLEPSEEAQAFFNPARRKPPTKLQHKSIPMKQGSQSGGQAMISFTYMDTVIFVRAAISVYLHVLTLQQSDITLVKTLTASLEIVKIFGIKIFSEAVGETLQHWMRVVSFHCGSRRAEVRVQASDFLELILRSTWDSFGSFFRIRLPLLSVQTEVMERIVATAAGRHYREQRMMGLGVDLFSNGSAEASLAPLWRTLDRLHHQSASQNVAFRSALMRLAEKVKKLFRAYVAAHALSFLHQAKPPEETDSFSDAASNLEAQTLIRASRISVHRVINASAGYSKQFLGLYSTSLEHSTVAHNEAVEDAFLAAADVFSPTELPDHRVAWLRRLAKFHSVRHRYAEEATCHYNIHITLQQASSLHGALWFSTPFLPWTNTKSDAMHLDGEGPAGDPDDTDFEVSYDNTFGRQIDKTNSFRRIFYRNENSIRVTGGELEAGTSKYAFYGVTLPSEYSTISPWTSMREMEANMLEEAEAAGDLFLKAGIIASSRYAWSLAVRHYAEKFNYGKLKHVYERLSNTVVSVVPPLDSNQQEVSVTVPLGRFYRVWFHGGAPDELIGAEFVYRTASHVQLEQFGKELKEVIRCIIPDNTPIHLVLDGRAEEREPQSYSGFRMGAQLEPVRVKVTPLRSMVTKTSRMRGLPEWFHDYIESAYKGQGTHDACGGRGLKRNSSLYSDGSVSDANTRPRHRDQGSSYSASMFSSSGNSVLGARRASAVGGRDADCRRFRQETYEGELVGADKFSFMQPINKGRDRGTRDWLRGPFGDFASKTLRVTQLQVGQAFPACVSRQAVVHRVVFTQSPLEAAIDSICQWCAILFRTAVATNGQAVLGINYDPGIGIEAAKVVSDCIHSSRVKEMGLYLLKKNTNFEEEEEGDPLHRYDRLSEDVVKKLQLRLARSLVVFMELLHLMVARNRELLLEVIQERKKGGETSSRHSHSASNVSLSDGRSNRSVATRQGSTANGYESFADLKRGEDSNRPYHRKKESASQAFGSLGNDDCSIASALTSEKARTDSAIGIQSELQRAFISLAKELHPKILGIMGSDSPHWLKQCSLDTYFSAYTYRNVKTRMDEELTFDDLDTSERLDRPTASSRSHSSQEGTGIIPVPLSAGSFGGPLNPGSPGGSLDSASVASKSSDAGRSNARSIKSFERGVDRLPASHHQKINRMSSL